MKWFHALVMTTAVLVLCSCCVTADLEESTDIPDLKGNWTGSAVGHTKMAGFFTEPSGTYLLVIADQKGPAFHGTLYYKYEGVTWDVEFSGVIGPDMKTLYLAEYDQGIDIATLTSPETIELVYIETGENAMAAIDSFVKEQPE